MLTPRSDFWRQFDTFCDACKTVYCDVPEGFECPVCALQQAAEKPVDEGCTSESERFRIMRIDRDRYRHCAEWAEKERDAANAHVSDLRQQLFRSSERARLLQAAVDALTGPVASGWDKARKALADFDAGNKDA